jgi:hypothetical protein
MNKGSAGSDSEGGPRSRARGVSSHPLSSGRDSLKLPLIHARLPEYILTGLPSEPVFPETTLMQCASSTKEPERAVERGGQESDPIASALNHRQARGPG